MVPYSPPAAPPIDVGALLSRLGTRDLEVIASTAIDLLDQRAGDCDLEDDDPAGDPLDILGEAQSDDGRALLAIRPHYDVDQSAGPTNFHAAFRQHQEAEYSLGSLRTGRAS